MSIRIGIRKSVSSLFICVMFLGISIQSSPSFGDQLAGGGKLSPDLNRKIEDVVIANSARIEAIFKDIHRNPELGFMEVRTSEIIKNELLSLGFDVTSGIGGTGVLAI